MYKFLILFLIVCSCTSHQKSSLSQTQEVHKPGEIKTIKTLVNGEWVQQEPDTPPTYKGGDEAMLMLLAKNIRYPMHAQRAGISGIALISAEVTEDGSLVNEKIEKDLGGGIGEESLRVIQLIPDNWNPATLNGVPVRTLINIPVRFTIIASQPQR